MVLDSEILTKEWRLFLQGRAKSENIFYASQRTFHLAWEDVKRDLGLDSLGPLHELRHSGAAQDVLSKSRSLEEVRRRGRWRSMTSVQRYTKTWMLVRRRAEMPAALVEKGKQIMLIRGKRTIQR